MELGYSKKDDPLTGQWDDFRFFVAVAKTSSIKRAALALGTTQPAVSKRLDRLEHTLGTRLFDRSASGSRLTYQGERILPRLLAAHREIVLARNEAQSAGCRIEGDCSLLMSDGIANYWVSRFLPSFFDAYPNIELRVVLGYDLTAPRDEIYDIRLHYFDPANPELIARPLATVHFLPFASRGYLERCGTPRTIADLEQHRILDSAQYLTSSSSWSAWFGDKIEKAVSLFTNQSAFLASCVLNGVGIALMPSYMVLASRDFVPLDIGLNFKTKLFASYRREGTLKQPVKVTLAFLRQLVFDPRTMPWFSENFEMPVAHWHDGAHAPATTINGQAHALAMKA